MSLSGDTPHREHPTPADLKNGRLNHFRFSQKTAWILHLAQTFITILMVHLSVVLGVYLSIKSRSNLAAEDFILGTGVVVMLCGMLVSFLWRFIAKMAIKRMLILADIADGP